MHFKKSIISSLLTISLVSISSIAIADVNFYNDSDSDLLIYRSAQYPRVFLNAHQTVKFDDASFNEMCQDRPDNCNFYLYKDCSGKESAMLTFSGENVVTIINQLDNIFISGSASNIYLKNG